MSTTPTTLEYETTIVCIIVSLLKRHNRTKNSITLESQKSI